MIWESISKYHPLPLLWNSFPYHPHKLGNKSSNRKPSEDEVKEGAVILGEIIDIFSPRLIIAVGKSAKNACERASENRPVSFSHVCHPSFGRKAEFNDGLAKILKKNCYTPT